MKRVFYIANSYDGRYFVLTDNIEEYVNRLSAYVLNLQNSAKTNHYSFGSVEMSEAEYQQQRDETMSFERQRIEQREQERPTLAPRQAAATTPMKEENSHTNNEQVDAATEEVPDNVIPLFQ